MALTKEEEALDKVLLGLRKEAGVSPDKLDFLRDNKIAKSELHSFCKDLPKGGDLHVHHIAALPSEEMVDFAEQDPQLYVSIKGDGTRGKLYAAPEEGIVPVAGAIPHDELVSLWNLSGRLPDENIWVAFEKIFDRHFVISITPQMSSSYYKYTFRYLCKQNILYVEIIILLFGTHEESMKTVQAIYDAYLEVKKEYPDFCVALRGAALKLPQFPMSLIETLVENACYVHEQFKTEENESFLVSFDLLNEEEASRPLSAFASLVTDAKKRCPTLEFSLHAGESCQPLPSIAEACRLGVKRIGHGLNLHFFPELQEEIIKKDICLEVCPVSNMVLGYVPNLCEHPGKDYLRSGVPMVISSDDPGYLCRSTLVDDFFAAILCWELSISEIKQLCMNSIRYASVSEAKKTALMQAWQKQWDAFVANWANR